MKEFPFRGMGVSGVIPLFIERGVRAGDDGVFVRPARPCEPLLDAGGTKTSSSSASHCFILASASCKAVADGAKILPLAADMKAIGRAVVLGDIVLADAKPAIPGAVAGANQAE